MPADSRPASGHTHRLKTGVLALAPLAIILTIVAAACGGGGSSPKSSAATAGPTTTDAGGRRGFNRAALQPFIDCMTQHGITMPTFAPRPSTAVGNTATTDSGQAAAGQGGGRRFGGGGGVGAILNSSDPTTKAALAACQSKIPPGLQQQIQQGQTARQAFISCMKDHGVTVQPGGFGPGGPNGSTTTTTPQFAAAFNTCRALLPQRSQFGPGGQGGNAPPASVGG